MFHETMRHRNELMKREAAHLATIKDLKAEIKSLKTEMSELKDSMRVAMGQKPSLGEEDYGGTTSTYNCSAETNTSALHHLYQDLFITDLKKEVNI